MNDDTAHFTIRWADAGRKARNPSNPAYPDGITLDLTDGRTPCCRVTLPYPAPQVGQWVIVCDLCKLRVVGTAAGRKDDPRAIFVPCKGRRMN